MCVESSKNKETTQRRSFTIPQSGSSSTIPEGEAKGGGGGDGVGWGNWVFSFLKDKLIPLKLIASKSCVLLIKIHVVSKIS